MIRNWFLPGKFSGDNESRKKEQGLRILRTISKAKEPLTIPLISEKVKLSVPTITRFINELKKQELVLEAGKIVTESGRKPIVYTLNRTKFYSVGVEILLNKLQVSIVDINMQPVLTNNAPDFSLKNTDKCRSYISSFIQETITKSEISTDNIIGAGVGITGRVNSTTGKTYNFFEHSKIPFADILSKELKIPVIVENDTRVIGLYESVAGKVKNIDNALIVNISSGIGMTMIANQTIIAGNSGFAGEFGHMQFARNENRACICGKRGCLDTEVSGKALEISLKEALQKGEQSFVFKADSTIHYSDIIKAANEGDLLSLTLLQKQGEKLGYALGNIINLLNPEVIVISGKYAKTEELFTNSVKTGLYKTGLKNPLAECKVVNSELGNDSGTLGSAALIFKNHELI